MINYLEGRVKNNPGKVILLAYQCNVEPKPLENDLLANKDCQQRKRFYGFTYVPYACFNGRSAGNNFNPNSITDNLINQEFQKAPNFTFSIATRSTSVSPHSCAITVTATALSDYTSQSPISLFAAIIEDSIDYQKVYGQAAKNGKNDYNHVLRKLLPDTTGKNIGNQKAGQNNSAEFTYTNDEKYQNHKNIRVIAFIQDMGSKSILGAFLTQTHPFQDLTPITSGPQTQKVTYLDINRMQGADVFFTLAQNCAIGFSVYNLQGEMMYQAPKRTYLSGVGRITLAGFPRCGGCYILSMSGADIHLATKIIMRDK